jgi:protein TonB
MNFDENNPGNAATAELEARVLAWICGEVPEAEAAEIERLAAERPELAEFKRQVEDAGRLVEEAVASDREPLRLSPRRRRALLKNLMPRQDLITSGALVVALMAAVAWWGEQSHYVAPAAALRTTTTQMTFAPTPEPDEQVMDERDQPKKMLEKVAPQQQDYAAPAVEPDKFRQPVEQIAPPSDGNVVQIPQMRYGPGAGEHPWDLSQLDQPPLATYQAKPDYPYELRRDGITGEVVVDFIVDSRGAVRNAVAARSTNHGFDEAACKAVGRWKFRPGRKDGHAVYVHMQVPIVFSLSDGD